MEEEAPLTHRSAQQAVHIGTVRKNAGPNAPRSSPTEMNDGGTEHAEEALKRFVSSSHKHIIERNG